MFILTCLEDDVRVQPQDLSKHPLDAVTDVLEAQYIDKVLQNIGLPVTIYDVQSIEGGFIYPNDGAAYFKVRRCSLHGACKMTARCMHAAMQVLVRCMTGAWLLGSRMPFTMSRVRYAQTIHTMLLSGTFSDGRVPPIRGRDPRGSDQVVFTRWLAGEPRILRRRLHPRVCAAGGTPPLHHHLTPRGFATYLRWANVHLCAGKDDIHGPLHITHSTP